MITEMIQYVYNDTTNAVYLPSDLCNTVYANDAQFLKTLNDPNNTFYCVDVNNPANPLDYIPAQQGFG